MDIKELVMTLNEQKIGQTSIEWLEDIPEDICKEYFKDKYTHLASGIDVDTHRWYELTIDVVKVLDGLLGVNHISNLFSESMSCSDADVVLEFFEMEEITVTSYKIKE